VALLPGPTVFRFGELLGAVAWHFLPQRRHIVLRNLRVAFAGEKTLADIQQLAKATFRRSGANLVSVAHTARLAPDELGKVIDIENLELLETALANGRGVVLLLAHMGNWELLCRLVHLFPPGSKAGAFYRPLNNPLLDTKVLARRQTDGTRMFSKRDPFHQVTGFLREGGIVGVLADQRVGMQGEVVPFFGRLTRTSPLPSLLARRAKAEVLALALVTERPGKWKAVFTPVEKPCTTPHCMAALETAMRCSPVDIFWLQDRWKVYAGQNRSFQNWLDAAQSSGSKPHRALVWLADGPPDWQLPEEWRHPDLTYEVVAPTGLASLAEIRSFLRFRENEQALPVDFILTPIATKALRLAAKREGIPIICLP